jgi:preprotein translocase subunit SecD
MAVPLPEVLVKPKGPALLYWIVSDSKPSEVTDAVKEATLKVVERRMNAGKEKFAEVSLGEGGKTVVIKLMRDSEEDKKRVERLMARSGTLEFRILATDRDKEIVEQAKKDEAEYIEADPLDADQAYLAPPKADVCDSSGKRLAYWAPFAYSSKEELEKYQKNILRTRKDANQDFKEILVLVDPQNVTGAYLAKAEVKDDELGHPSIHFTFNDTGGKLFGQLTGEHLPDPEKPENRYQLGIILDGKLYSAPSIIWTITNNGQITGNFTKEEAADIVDVLNAGSLPVKLVPAR